MIDLLKPLPSIGSVDPAWTLARLGFGLSGVACGSGLVGQGWVGSTGWWGREAWCRRVAGRSLLMFWFVRKSHARFLRPTVFAPLVFIAFPPRGSPCQWEACRTERGVETQNPIIPKRLLTRWERTRPATVPHPLPSTQQWVAGEGCAPPQGNSQRSRNVLSPQLFRTHPRRLKSPGEGKRREGVEPSG